MIYCGEIKLATIGNTDIKDITQEIKRILLDSSVNNGSISLFVPGSTGALTTIEYEPGAISDLKRFLDENIPEGREYEHNKRWGDGNGHSHLRAALLGPSLVVPVINGEMTLGTWQQIIFIDCDNRARNRTIIVQISGE